MADTPKAFVSWSGGKDCCLAYHRAARAGLDVRRLLNMVTEDSRFSRSHGLAAAVLGKQAQAIGAPLLQQRATDATYEAEFKSALLELKKEGITAGVFGDIDFNAHREWIDRVCSETGITPHLPLWLIDQKQLMNEFIAAGFRAVVVATDARLLGEEWVGREINADFLADLAKIPGVTPCGEAGEYHTLVVDGPIFIYQLVLGETMKVLREEHWFLDIIDCTLHKKPVTAPR